LLALGARGLSVADVPAIDLRAFRGRLFQRKRRRRVRQYL